MLSLGVHHLPSHFCQCSKLLENISFSHPKKWQMFRTHGSLKHCHNLQELICFPSWCLPNWDNLCANNLLLIKRYGFNLYKLPDDANKCAWWALLQISFVDPGCLILHCFCQKKKHSSFCSHEHLCPRICNSELRMTVKKKLLEWLIFNNFSITRYQ